MKKYLIIKQQYPRGTVAIQVSLTEFLRIQRVVANMAYETDVKIDVQKGAGKSFLTIEKGAMGALKPNGTWRPSYKVIACKTEYDPFGSPSDAERLFLDVDRKIEEIAHTTSDNRTYLFFDGFMSFEEISEKEYYEGAPFSLKNLFRKR